MLRLIALIGCSISMSLVHAQDLRFPFQGRWFVAQGGDTLNVNHHMAVEAQWFGVDFVKVGGLSKRELAAGNASRYEDFYSWGQPVLAPHGGEVVAVVDGLPDNALGAKDAANPAGNYMGIRIAPSRFVFLAHFQRGSITAKVGDHITSGQPLGKCGNSGNSDLPHIHLHVQDQPIFNTGRGQPFAFAGMDVELSGKAFENVTWPLIRGFFVSPH